MDFLVHSIASPDKDWQGFLPKNVGLLQDMHSTVLLPTAFSPLG